MFTSKKYRKLIQSFCTSSSSGIGDSSKLLKEATKGGDWKDGHRFSGSASDNDIGVAK